MKARKKPVTENQGWQRIELSAKIRREYYKMQMRYENLLGRYTEQASTNKIILSAKGIQDKLLTTNFDKLDQIQSKQLGQLHVKYIGCKSKLLGNRQPKIHV